MIFLDAITPFERIKISGALASKVTELQSDLSALARVRVSREVLELLAKLEIKTDPPVDGWLATGRTMPQLGDDVFTENPAILGGVDIVRGVVKTGAAGLYVSIGDTETAFGTVSTSRKRMPLTPRWTKAGETSPYQADMESQASAIAGDREQVRGAIETRRDDQLRNGFFVMAADITPGDALEGENGERMLVADVGSNYVEMDDGRTYPIDAGRLYGFKMEGADDGLSDDPNAENYRYRDTGYIAGSRKELAEALIKRAKEEGRQVLATDLDWEEIERNPRAAAEIITKSNLFGQTDWEALQAGGMSAATGFLIDRVYASIGTQPAESTPRARQDYAIALKTIRERLEGCKEPQDVLDVLAEIRQELSGSQLNAEETLRYEALQAQVSALSDEWRRLNAEREALVKAQYAANSDIWEFQRKQDQRTRRGWKPDPELQERIDALKPAQDAAVAAVQAWDEAHPDFKESYVTTRNENGSTISHSGGLRFQMGEVRKQMTAIEKAAQIRNISESPVTRGWLTFGERFFKVINYRHYSKGSDAFASHVTNAKNGRIPDWSWASKEKVAVKRATKKEIGFQLKVADTMQRIGGRPVSVDSTFALKDMLGFRDVQSGNWVLKDPASAKYHVEQTAGAMLDLSDLLGIDVHAIGLGGRLGMAFGARGTGNAGGSSAKAHYESVHRVINLTKMGGGGALGHEWFHAIDDMLAELATGQVGEARNYASADVSRLPEGPLRSAMSGVYAAMMAGNVRVAEIIKIGPKDKRLAAHNIDTERPNSIAKAIKAAGALEPAVLAVRDFFKGRSDKRSMKNEKQWVALAAAYYSPEGAEYAQAKTGPKGSSFYAEAVRLDEGQADKYWSRRHEMAARAFQSWCEDRLQGQGRKSDYLSSLADNKYHYDPMFGIQWNPYPEGEEREAINRAFDDLFAAIRDERVFEKAMSNKALLDAIFGTNEPQEELKGLLHELRQPVAEEERVRMAQRVIELIPQVVFDSPEEEEAAVAAAAQILEEMA